MESFSESALQGTGGKEFGLFRLANRWTKRTKKKLNKLLIKNYVYPPIYFLTRDQDKPYQNINVIKKILFLVGLLNEIICRRQDRWKSSIYREFPVRKDSTYRSATALVLSRAWWSLSLARNRWRSSSYRMIRFIRAESCKKKLNKATIVFFSIPPTSSRASK